MQQKNVGGREKCRRDEAKRCGERRGDKNAFPERRRCERYEQGDNLRGEQCWTLFSSWR